MRRKGHSQADSQCKTGGDISNANGGGAQHIDVRRKKNGVVAAYNSKLLECRFAKVSVVSRYRKNLRRVSIIAVEMYKVRAAYPFSLFQTAVLLNI